MPLSAEKVTNIFSFALAAIPGTLEGHWGGTTNALSYFFAESPIRRDGVGGGCNPLRRHIWRESATKHGSRGKGPAVRDRVLLQGEMGTCGGVSGALQEESLSGAKEGNGTRAHAESEHGDAALPHDGRRALGLSRNHRVQERGHRQRQFR